MEKECGDEKCPVHGPLKTRKKTITGKVVRAKNRKTCIVEISYVQKVPKYERYQKKKSRIPVHVPDCMEPKEGDQVEARETRKLSKTKSFVLTKVLKSA